MDRPSRFHTTMGSHGGWWNTNRLILERDETFRFRKSERCKGRPGVGGKDGDTVEFSCWQEQSEGKSSIFIQITTVCRNIFPYNMGDFSSAASVQHSISLKGRLERWIFRLLS